MASGGLGLWVGVSLTSHTHPNQVKAQAGRPRGEKVSGATCPGFTETSVQGSQGERTQMGRCPGVKGHGAKEKGRKNKECSRDRILGDLGHQGFGICPVATAARGI